MALWNDYLTLWQRTAERLMGQPAEPVVQPAAEDRRFRDREWSDNAVFDYIKYSTTASDCTPPSATAPRPKPSPTTTAAPRPDQHDPRNCPRSLTHLRPTCGLFRGLLGEWFDQQVVKVGGQERFYSAARFCVLTCQRSQAANGNAICCNARLRSAGRL